MKVRLSFAARAYLQNETAYMRKQSPSGAKSFAKRMKTARENIGFFNGLGAESRDLPIPVRNMRRLIVGDYFMDYEIGEDVITILAVRNQLQMPMTVKPDENAEFEYEEDKPPLPSIG